MEITPQPENAELTTELTEKNQRIQQLEAQVNKLNQRLHERTLTLSQHLSNLRGNNAQLSPLDTMLLQVRTRILNDVTRNMGMPDTLAQKREFNLLVIAATEFIQMLRHGLLNTSLLAANILDDVGEQKQFDAEVLADISEGLRILADGFKETVETAYYWVPDRIDVLKADLTYDSEDDAVPAPHSLPDYIAEMRHADQFQLDKNSLNVLLSRAFDIDEVLVE